MKKSFKDLFIISEEKEQKEDKKDKKVETKFPEASFPTSSHFPSSNTSTPVNNNIPLECAPHMDTIMDLYKNGFEQLNQPGIDFFEFFKAVMDGGDPNSPAAYKMAFKMLSTMQKGITKDTLTSQSQFYIEELTKVHSNYNSEGIKRKSDLIAAKNSEDQKLKGEVQLLKDQLESIKTQIASKETQISQIDNKYQPKINEFDCKLMANDNAKNRILSSLTVVVNGIQQHL